MNSSVLVVIAMLAGCAVVPVTQETRATVGGRRLSDETKTQRGAMRLEIAAASSTAVVTVSWPRTCQRHYVQTVAHHKWKEARIEGFRGGGGNIAGSGNGAFLLVAILPAVFAVTAVVTGITVAADRGGTTTTEEVDAGAQTWACPEGARGLAVQLTLPSGEVLEGVTNERSLVIFKIPLDEPSGELVARVGDTVSAPVAYSAVVGASP